MKGKSAKWKRENRLINSPCPLPVTLARVSLDPYVRLKEKLNTTSRRWVSTPHGDPMPGVPGFIMNVRNIVLKH